MSCWVCEVCRVRNCDTDECTNPKCPTRNNVKGISGSITFPKPDQPLKTWDTFPKEGEEV